MEGKKGERETGLKGGLTKGRENLGERENESDTVLKGGIAKERRLEERKEERGAREKYQKKG